MPTPDPLDPRLSAWSTFLRAHARVTRALERELHDEQQLALADYDVLVQLARADERRLRMGELADRLLLSRSGITRRRSSDGLSGSLARRKWRAA